MSEQVGAGIRSGDGRWEWDGHAWRPLPPADPFAPTSSPAPRADSSLPPPPAHRPFASPAPRGGAAASAIGFACVGLVLGALGDVISIAVRSGATGGSLSANEQAVVDLVIGMPAIMALLGYAAGAVAVPLWCHRVYRNLPALGARDLRFTPARAAGGWFIPVIALWWPYQALQDVWRHSLPEGQPSTLLKAYWATWLIANQLGLALAFSSGRSGIVSDSLDLVDKLIILAAGALGIVLVARITRGQRSAFASSQARTPDGSHTLARWPR